MARKVTMTDLKNMHACSEQRKLFYNRFGLETTVTKARVLRYAGVFDWWWGRWIIKDKEQRRKFGRWCDLAEKKRSARFISAQRKHEVLRQNNWNDYTGGRKSKAEYESLREKLIEDNRAEIGAAKLFKRRSLAVPFYEAYNGKL